MKTAYWGDLHCHTTASDGSMTPVELIKRAKEVGLKGLSITDHDTVEAYHLAIKAAKESGLSLGTGIELSSEFKGFPVHLLGYDFDLSSRMIHQLCHRHQEQREERNRAILKKLEEIGFPITYEELTFTLRGRETIGRPHIAQLMLKKGYIKTFKEAFTQYLGENKRCYVRYTKGASFSIDEAMGVIRCSGGKLFIAHPQLLPKRLLKKGLLEFSFDGLEGYYARIPDRGGWVAIAKTNGWLVSGGSDFHGSSKPINELGCNGVDRETFYAIFEKCVA